MQREVALWIDHRQAVLAAVPGDTEDLTRILSGLEKHVRFSPVEGGAEDARDRRLEGHLNQCHDKVIAAIRDARSILILGPGEAKHEVQRLRDAGRGRSVDGVENRRQDDRPPDRGFGSTAVSRLNGARRL